MIRLALCLMLAAAPVAAEAFILLIPESPDRIARLDCAACRPGRCGPRLGRVVGLRGHAGAGGRVRVGCDPCRPTRDLAAAEDALAQVFRATLDTWPRTGIPDRPEAWLMTAAFPDHRLGLMFASTHPALDSAVQTPLMRQCVLGLAADRIAPAFLMTAAALGQRLSRAKARLQAEGAAFAIPDADLASEAVHLDEVLASLAPDPQNPAPCFR